MNLNWNQIVSENDIEKIKEDSKEKKVLIFKHSTRCGVSSRILSRLEQEWQPEMSDKIVPYFLNLVAYRNLSNRIAQDFGVRHESPQALVISDGACIYNDSHFGIQLEDIAKLLP